MPTVTFTAEYQGETFTRTTGSMPYVAITVGSQVIWHKSLEAAHRAATSRQQTWNTNKPADVVPVTPAAINGKLGDWTPHIDGWGDIPASAFAALVDGPKAKVTGKSTGGNSLDGPGTNGRAQRNRKTAAKTPAKTAAPTETPGEVKGAWTADELAWVAANVDLPLDVLARTLSRTVNSVRHKVRAAERAA